MTKLLLVLLVIVGVMFAAVALFESELASSPEGRRVMREAELVQVALAEPSLSGRIVRMGCVLPETRWAVMAAGLDPCYLAFWRTSKRVPLGDALLVRAGMHVAVYSGVLGAVLGLFALVRGTETVLRRRRAVGYLPNLQRRTTVVPESLPPGSDLRLRSSHKPSMGDIRLDVLRFGGRRRALGQKLLRTIAAFGDEPYLTSKEKSEGRFADQVRLMYYVARRVAERFRFPILVMELQLLCVLAQELGKLDAFFKSGRHDTFSYAGPQHQTKSAAILRAMPEFHRLPKEERELILRLVGSHHEELLPDHVHPSEKVMRDVMRKAENLREKLQLAAASA